MIREKIYQELCDWENEDINVIVEKICQALIEALPKERNEFTITEHQRKYNKEQGYPEDFCPPDEKAQGFNEALNQFKKLINP